MRKLLSIAVVAGLGLAACGGSDDSATSEAPADSTATGGSTATSEMTESSEMTEANPADCGADTLALHTAGQLTVATGEAVYEPWMADDDPANGKGYESAFVYELAKRMGLEGKVEWVRTTFDEAITPAEKAYDFNIQQYSITPEREEIVDFSHPYYIADRTVMAMKGSPADGATTFEGLADVKWAATAGTNDLTYIEDVIGAKDVAVFNTQADTIAAMTAGTADATVVNLPTAYYLTAVEIPEAVIAGVLPAGGEGADELGLLFADGSPLVPCVNVAIDAMTADGTLDALATQWLQGEGAIPDITK